MKKENKQPAGKTKIQQPEQPNKNNRYLLISVLAIVVSFIYSYKLRWLGDDIFIGLRYVQNFVAGNGIVYNKGERVEGYTHFLWILLISFFSLLKCSPLITVKTLGILSSLGTLILVSVMGNKIAKKNNIFIIPFITLALALNYDYNVWATGGLETSIYCFLLCTSFYIFFFSSLQDTKKLILSGLFLCLAMLERPDGLMIFLIVNTLMIFYQLINRNAIGKIIKLLLFFNLAFIVIYIPYFIWRYNYYGFIFPNTYYDKLGGETLFSKGFYYLWLYFKPHFTTFLIVILPPFVLLPLLKNKPLEKLKTFISDKWNAAYLTCIIMVYAYLVIFVAKVGGDFMHARFVIPMTPFIYFIIFYSLLKYSFKIKLNTVLVVLLLCSFIETNIRFHVFDGKDKDGNDITTLNRDVADERWAYTTYFPIENDIKLGKAIHSAFEGIDARMLIKGGQACLGYFANFGYIQEFHGLTDTVIAHSKVEHRGRIGHEKSGTIEHFEKKNIHFVFPVHARPVTKDTFRFARINYGGYEISTEILTYDNKIISQVKAKLGENFLYTDFPMYLDNYIQNKLPYLPHNKIKSDYDNFYLYYFKNNDDRLRENPFLTALGKQ